MQDPHVRMPKKIKGHALEFSVVMTSDSKIRILNRDYRGKDKPTNVLSFPAAPKEALAKSPMVGDIAVAFETVTREAQEEGKTFADYDMDRSQQIHQGEGA